MLTQLHIKNFVLVESLTIDWQSNMTAITGETGAGKSIMLDALSLTLGERANSGLIRLGAEKAEVVATFDCSNKPAAKAQLMAMDVDEDECILRRVLNRDGSSKAWINGIAVTLKQLKAIAEHLIDIHSQHEHQSLLQNDTQRQLLDDYGNYPQLLNDVATAWKSWRKTQQQIAELSDNDQSFEQQYELLSYQLEELEAFSLTEDEYQTLVKQQQLLSSGSELQQACDQIQHLSQQQEVGNIDSFIQTAIRLLDQQAHLPEGLNQARELLSQMDIINSELADHLRRTQDTIEIDPEQLAQVESRLAHFHDLARKHRVTPENLFSHYQQLSDQLAAMQAARESLETLQQQSDQQQQSFYKLAKALSDQRQQVAGGLSQAINGYFEALSMQGAELRIAKQGLPIEQASEYGIDAIEFLVRTNVGQPHSQLKKIVSGGELSRISLAISVVTAQTSTVPTMIFDEVDSGIGGATAEMIGKLLHQIGNSAQVICITHLPQVAARASHQLQVMKTVQHNQTSIQMQPLNTEQRIEEIARMSSGETIGKESIAFAKALLKN